MGALRASSQSRFWLATQQISLGGKTMKGSLKERSPGHWAIILDARDPQTGKRRRRWHSFRGTKRQAQIECARLITEIETGAAVDPTRITLSEFLDRFERDWISIHVTPASAQRYKLSLAYARQHLGDRRLQTLRPADLAAFYAAFSRSLAPRTVRHAHLVLHKALEQAKLWGLVRDNPADLAKPPPIPETEISILQPDQARELLERLSGHALYMLAASLGRPARGAMSRGPCAGAPSSWTPARCESSRRSSRRMASAGPRPRRRARGAGRSPCRWWRSCGRTGAPSRSSAWLLA